jgi:parallel beta-helix repeat protein
MFLTWRSWLKRTIPVSKAARLKRIRRKTFRPVLDALEDRRVPAPVLLTVTTNLDEADGGTLRNPAGPDGKLSLREAIMVADVEPATVELVTIDFSINRGPQLIQIRNTPLPIITHRVTIDGTSQPGFDPVTHLPVITLDGIAIPVGSGGNGLTIAADGCTVKGLDIVNFANGFGTGSGIELRGHGGAIIQGNIIGTDQTGTGRLPNNTGIFVNESVKNTIGGAAAARNIISGNVLGIQIFDDNNNQVRERRQQNVVLGNYIGTSPSGTRSVMNLIGVSISGGAGNTIGTGNTISGNDAGMELSGMQSLDNTIAGNVIGLDPDGQVPIPNTRGILVTSAPDNLIGGMTPAARNIISGNQFTGIGISGTGNTVIGNYIGLDATGMNRIPGQSNAGVSVSSAGNVIGGMRGGAENVISGNVGAGIKIQGADGDKILGNFIGVNASGTSAVPNLEGGVVLESAEGTLVDGNLISGNSNAGIDLSATQGSLIFGNRIGTDLSGTEALGRQPFGIILRDEANLTRIGGPESGERNLISGNALDGIEIFGLGTAENRVQGNFIGTDISGLTAVSNGRNGVLVLDAAARNLIGGSSLETSPLQGEGNLISGNRLNGIEIEGSDTGQTLVQGNYIGTRASGTGPLRNGRDGILIEGSPSNVVGGGRADFRNVICANQRNGILISGATAGRNDVLGNFIGTDFSGAANLGNAEIGVLIDGAPNNWIGDKQSANVISGNGKGGVTIRGNSAQGNQMRSDLIGTAQDGTQALANRGDGVDVINAPANTIGGLRVGDANTISGNTRFGVDISGGFAFRNSVMGNRVGTDRAGNAAIPNGLAGIVIEAGAFLNTIGGTDLVNEGGRLINRAANVISGNRTHQVLIKSSQNQVLGNFIGTNADGSQALSNRAGVNSGNGVEVLGGLRNTIGGSKQGEGNLISGNAANGVAVFGDGSTSDDNQIIGNNIGLNADLTSPVANGRDGVFLSGAVGDLVSSNTIAGNDLDGLGITNRSTRNRAVANSIGVVGRGARQTPIPNGANGVLFNFGSEGNTIESNVIAFNTAIGIRDGNAPQSNTFTRNEIFSNGPAQSTDPHGIDVGPIGPSRTGVPVLTTIVDVGGQITVRGTVIGPTGATFIVELYANQACDPSGFGQGAFFVTSTQATTNGVGLANFTFTLKTPIPGGTFLTALATLPAQGTSELSRCLQVPP